MVPALGLWAPRMQRVTVDLPQPDSPTTPRVSPWRMSKDTPSTARTGRALPDPNSFARGANTISRSRTSTRLPGARSTMADAPGRGGLGLFQQHAARGAAGPQRDVRRLALVADACNGVVAARVERAAGGAGE